MRLSADAYTLSSCTTDIGGSDRALALRSLFGDGLELEDDTPPLVNNDGTVDNTR